MRRASAGDVRGRRHPLDASGPRRLTSRPVPRPKWRQTVRPIPHTVTLARPRYSRRRPCFIPTDAVVNTPAFRRFQERATDRFSAGNALPEPTSFPTVDLIGGGHSMACAEGIKRSGSAPSGLSRSASRPDEPGSRPHANGRQSARSRPKSSSPCGSMRPCRSVTRDVPARRRSGAPRSHEPHPSKSTD